MDSQLSLEDLEKKIKSADSLFDTAHGLAKAQILATALEIKLFDYLESEEAKPKNLEDI